MIRRFEYPNGYWVELKLDNGDVLIKTSNYIMWMTSSFDSILDGAKFITSLGYEETFHPNVAFDGSPLPLPTNDSIEKYGKTSGKVYSIDEPKLVVEKYTCKCSMTQLMRGGCSCNGV